MSPFRFVLGVRRRCANALKNHLQSIPKALADRGYTPSTTTRAATTLPRYCPSAAVKGTRRGLAGSLHHWSGARRNPVRSYSLHAQATATRLHPGATLATAPARIYYARQWAKIKWTEIENEESTHFRLALTPSSSSSSSPCRHVYIQSRARASAV